MGEVLQGRLDSHGYRMGFVCNLLITTYESGTITADIKEKLITLAEILTDAAKTAHRFNETELAILCGSLTRQLKAVAEGYENPTQSDFELFQKINKAVVAAMKPNIPPDQLNDEARDAAQTYQQRERGDF